MKKRKTFLVLLLMILVGVSFVSAGNIYYVDDSTGNDVSGTGSINSPWKTIQYAIDHQSVGSGDTVHVNAGNYHESITINKEGLTLEGTLGLNGERLSVIDPYVDVSNNSVDYPGEWTHAGNGVYRKYIGWKSWGYLVEIDSVKYKVHRQCYIGEEHGKYNCNGWMSNMQIQDTPEYSCIANGRTYGPISWWWGIEALGTGTDDDMWLSFADDSNVNEKIIYATTGNRATIELGADNIIIKDFDIRGKFYGIYSPSVSNIIIKNNKIIYGNSKIYFLSGENITIKDNLLDDYNYAEMYIAVNNPSKSDYVRGAYSHDYRYQTTSSAVKTCLLDTIKYQLTADANGDDSRPIFINGNGITITGNEMGYFTSGINLRESLNIELSNNYVHHLAGSSVLIIAINNGGRNTSIHDNFFIDVNAGIRLSPWEGDALNVQDLDGFGNNNADIKIYNNRIWLPSKPIPMGTHIKFWYNFYPNIGQVVDPGTAWIYHNSFSGGLDLINVGSYHAYYNREGMEEVYFLNNIMSSKYIYNGWSTNGVCNPTGCIPSPIAGGFYNNWQGGENTKETPGLGNIIQSSYMWNTIIPHNFTVPSEYIDIINNGGTNLSLNYPNLPGGFSTKQIGWIAPIVSCDDNDGDGVTTCDGDCNDNNPLIFPGQTESCANDFDDNCDGIICKRTDINSDGFSDIKDIRICMNNFIMQNEYFTNCSKLFLPDNVLDLNDVREIVKNI